MPSTRVPELDIRTDGETEEFIPEGAAYFFDTANREDIQVRDDGRVLQITGTDANGDRVILAYRASNVTVGVAEYSQPDDEVTFTTAPENVEHEVVYTADEGVKGASLVIDGRAFSPEDGDLAELWNRGEAVEAEENYVTVTGLDDADPVPNQFDAHWKLETAAFSNSQDTPFYTASV